MISKKLKNALLGGAMALTCVFSMGALAACGEDDSANTSKTGDTIIRVETTPTNTQSDTTAQMLAYEAMQRYYEALAANAERDQQIVDNKQAAEDAKSVHDSEPAYDIVKVPTTSVDQWMVLDNGMTKTFKEAFDAWTKEAEQIKNEQIEYYRNASKADDSTPIINDTFKVEAVMIADGVRYSTNCNFDILFEVARAANNVSFEFNYYFESHGYSVIELNWFKSKNDVHKGSKTVNLIKTSIEVSSQFYYTSNTSN